MTPGTMGLLSPLRDVQQCPPAGLCPRCHGSIYPGESRFVWDGVAVCTDCFQTLTGRWLERFPEDVACALGISVLPPEGRWQI